MKFVSWQAPVAYTSVTRRVDVIIGSLSNYDDDHNDDFKKTIGLMIKTTALHVQHAF